MHGGEWPYPCLRACHPSTRERQNLTQPWAKGTEAVRGGLRLDRCSQGARATA